MMKVLNYGRKRTHPCGIYIAIAAEVLRRFVVSPELETVQSLADPWTVIREFYLGIPCLLREPFAKNVLNYWAALVPGGVNVPPVVLSDHGGSHGRA